MKKLLPLLVILFIASPLYADQALVLTEIEQIQEKIWYLQRDLAEQKSAIAKQQEQFTRISAGTEQKQRELEKQLTATAATLAGQQESLQEFAETVQKLQETVSTLADEFNRQKLSQKQQVEQSGTQQGQLRDLREDFASSRKQTEQALAEMQQQLAETRSELAALKTDQGGRLNQLVLWGGGSALALAILLTIVLAFRSGRSRQYTEKREYPTKHEL